MKTYDVRYAMMVEQSVNELVEEEDKLFIQVYKLKVFKLRRRVWMARRRHWKGFKK